MADQNKELSSNVQYGVGYIPYHVHNGTDSPKVKFNDLFEAPRFFVSSTPTNGTHATYVFGTPLVTDYGAAPYNLTITGAFADSISTTTSSITIKNNSDIVAVITKGNLIGGMYGTGAIANTVCPKGNTLTVEADTGGNAYVFITYTA